MKSFVKTFAFAAIGATVISTAAMADHNSVNGAGWANMPNDIHNIQIEDNLDSTEFRDLVKGGGVRDLENRYDTDTETTSRGSDRASVDRGSRR